MSEDLVLRLVSIEVISALLADESILDHTKERLRSAVGQLGQSGLEDKEDDAPISKGGCSCPECAPQY